MAVFRLCAVGILAALFLASCCDHDCCSVVVEDQEHLPIVGAEDLDEPLTVVETCYPVYPEEARQEEHEGTVITWVIVNSDGYVGRAGVDSSSSYPELDAAAVDAAMEFRFTEPRRGGCPVRTRLLIPFRFSLTD